MSWDIVNICNIQENYLSPQCNCINPPVLIKSIADNMLAPYYCWYAPCLDGNSIKSPEIIQGQRDCKITNCSIKISEISTTGGKITIQNICAKSLLSSNTNYNITVKDVYLETQLPVFNLSTILITSAIVIIFMSYIM